MKTNRLKHVRNLTWEGVFETWRSIEEDLPHWKDFWKAKGFKSWSDWRQATHANLRGPELSWVLYQVLDPLNEVPNWRGGMFSSWAKWFYPSFFTQLSQKPPRLRDLLEHPGVQNHWYVREIASHFPKETTVTALRLPNDEIVVVEGMHRCCALTLADRDRTKPIQTDLTVALAPWPFGDLPKLGTGWEK